MLAFECSIGIRFKGSIYEMIEVARRSFAHQLDFSIWNGEAFISYRLYGDEPRLEWYDYVNTNKFIGVSLDEYHSHYPTFSVIKPKCLMRHNGTYLAVRDFAVNECKYFDYDPDENLYYNSEGRLLGDI